MVGFLEAWLAQKAMQRSRERLQQKLGDLSPDSASSILDLVPTQGARWLLRADGSWARWSYLGESWEDAAPPVIPPLEAKESPGVPVEWIEHGPGRWERVEANGVAQEALLTEVSPPAPPEPVAPGADLVVEDPVIDLGDPQEAGDWTGAAFVVKNVAVACAYTVPIALVAYFVVWAVSLVANLFTSLMSPWLFDEPSPMLSLTIPALLWVVAAAAPVGFLAGLIRSMTRSS